MGRGAALQLAPADPLGRRWARAHSCGRDYLAWQGPDGEGMQVTDYYFGIRRSNRLPEPPAGLHWWPVRVTWQELAGLASEPPGQELDGGSARDVSGLPEAGGR